jgi:uncharacterized protein YxeA
VVKVKSGISLITVIITIIVLIILASISIRTLTTSESASTAKYIQEFTELKKEVETKRVINSKTRSFKRR